MATWTNITNAALEPGKPIRSVDGIALRDNPIAMAEGASGAPKIQNAAMDDDTVDDRLLTGSATTVGRDWVLARAALATAGALGTYAFASASLTGHGFGSTVAGSSLGASSASGDGDGTSLTGTWRCMGGVGSSPANAEQATTLWLRIS